MHYSYGMKTRLEKMKLLNITDDDERDEIRKCSDGDEKLSIGQRMVPGYNNDIIVPAPKNPPKLHSSWDRFNINLKTKSFYVVLIMSFFQVQSTINARIRAVQISSHL